MDSIKKPIIMSVPTQLELECLEHLQTKTQHELDKFRIRLQSTITNLPQCGIACIKCQQQMVRFQLIQKRSGDEGATAYFTCTLCNHQWRRN